MKTGHEFRGWAVVIDGEIKTAQPGGTITLTGDNTLGAVWLPIHLTVKYTGGTSDSVFYGLVYTVKTGAEAGVEREGYQVTGWSITEGGAAAYTPGQTVTLTANLTLYPVWTLRTYNITFFGNGGSGVPDDITKTAFVDVTIPMTIPERTGYDFKGWSVIPDGWVFIHPGDVYSENASLVLYAKWEEASGFIRAATHEGVKKARVYVQQDGALKRAYAYVMKEGRLVPGK